jgi:hypothetical protein
VSKPLTPAQVVPLRELPDWPPRFVDADTIHRLVATIDVLVDTLKKFRGMTRDGYCPDCGRRYGHEPGCLVVRVAAWLEDEVS